MHVRIGLIVTSTGATQCFELEGPYANRDIYLVSSMNVTE